MRSYHKIVTVWTRDPATSYKALVEGEWATPEFAYLKDNQWLFSEKFDGMNVRVGWDGETVTFGGRTDRANIPAKLVARLIELFPAEKFVAFDGPVVLFGEGYGGGIQKGGGKYREDQGFILFDVYVGEDQGIWLERDNVVDIAENMGIDAVPVVGVGPLEDAIAWVRHPLKSTIGDHEMEGLVMRPAVELLDRRGSRVITKIKAKDFKGA